MKVHLKGQTHKPQRLQLIGHNNTSQSWHPFICTHHSFCFLYSFEQTIHRVSPKINKMTFKISEQEHHCEYSLWTLFPSFLSLSPSFHPPFTFWSCVPFFSFFVPLGIFAVMDNREEDWLNTPAMSNTSLTSVPTSAACQKILIIVSYDTAVTLLLAVFVVKRENETLHCVGE